MSTISTPTPFTAEPSEPRHSKRRILWSASLIALCAAIGIWILAFNGRPFFDKPTKKNGAEQTQSKPASGPTLVEVAYPLQGGIDRVCLQPGTVDPFESADLYAKVSGFLVETLDIGVRVRKNEVLARISVPEYEKQVDKDKASVARSEAKLKQMEAHLAAAKAEAKASKQMIVQAGITLKSKTAFRKYRELRLELIKKLDKEKAIEATIVDQSTDQFEAAFEAEEAAREAVTTAQLQSETAVAKVAQAEADIEDAKAEVEVAKAELERSKVLLDYTIIRSPYDGVVTKRNFHPGAFIRSADVGGDRVPVVAVDRTDLMRIVVQVPDRDVPYVKLGEKATIEIAALESGSGKQPPPIKGVIARFAESEDAQTRTMRTEIDVPNPDGKLRRNMYGRVRIVLQNGSPTALRIPSSALVTNETTRQTVVRVMRDHRVHLVPVEVGQDTGVEVEILRGLQPTDEVIVRANGPLEEGTEVTTEVPAQPDADADAE
jgi:HlyD family secretion protein